MSLPRYKVTMIAVSLGLATALVGCSTTPKKKDVVDTGPVSSEQIYFDKAMKSLDRGQYGDAAKALEDLDTYFPTGNYAQQAQLELLYTKFQQKDYEGVIALADRFIRMNPQHPNADYAYYIRGVANMEQNYDSLLRYTSLQQSHRDIGYLKVAYQNFVDFIRRYPSSKYAVDAAQRMKYIGQELAEGEMNTARFNIKRKAYLAAIERSQWVVEHYPQSPQIPEALATMAYGYGKLGDKATEQQYINVLKLNYPHLVKNNGEVNLRAARREGSVWNRLTLGILGQKAESSTQVSTASESKQAVANTEKQGASWLNRMSFGLLDRPDRDATTEYAQAGESLYDPQRNKAAVQEVQTEMTTTETPASDVETDQAQ